VRVEQRRLAAFSPPQRFREKRADERVELVRRAVIGVRATKTPDSRATSWAKAASALAPILPCPTAAPEVYAAPPVVSSTMPSDSASAKPRSAAFRVSDELTLTAGYA
jgi:hypothetical protein